MTELIFVLTATILVFALYLLVFFFKVRSESDQADRPGCADCNCHRNQRQPKRFTRLPDEMRKALDPDR